LCFQDGYPIIEITVQTFIFTGQSMAKRDIYKDILFGISIGDALGVPAEFKSRETMKQSQVTDMKGYGTYYLPAGTFSDDSSLTFCLAEALISEFDLQRLADNFIAWQNFTYSSV
jgi:ADP-ribosylglycohydrolase